MNLNSTMLIILALGVFLGLLIGNKNFRVKFFISFRKFLSGINTGQKRGREEQAQGRPEQNVKHRYVQTHHLVECPRCEGTGKITKEMPKLLSAKLLGVQTKKCPDCNGTGKVYD